MTALEERMSQRQKEFKKGIDTSDARRKREEDAVQLRKTKKDEILTKRRFVTDKENEDGNVPECAMEDEKRSLPEVATALLNAQSAEEALPLAKLIRSWLTQPDNPPIQSVVEHGLVARFAEFMRDCYPAGLRFESAWVLTNIASGSHDDTEAVVHAGVLPQLMTMAASDDGAIRDQAIWGIGNIAGDCTFFRDEVLRAGAVDVIVTQLNRLMQEENPSAQAVQTSTWALSNLVRGKPAPPVEVVMAALPVFCDLCKSSDAGVAVDACWGLSYVSDGHVEAMQGVVDSGVLYWMVDLILYADASDVEQPALRVLGNVLTGTPEQTDAVLEVGFLKLIPLLLSSTKKALKKDCLWAISNTTAGTPEQIQTVLNYRGPDESTPQPRPLDLVIEHCKEGIDYDLRKEAVWCLANAFMGSEDQQVDHLLEYDLIVKSLVDMLGCQDEQMVAALLQAFDRILSRGVVIMNNAGANVNQYAEIVEEAGGLDALEKLQDCGSEQVYTHVCHIITAFFGVDDEDASDDLDDGSAPAGGFNFAAP